MKKIEELFLGIVLSLFSVLRFPSLFEPYWYGDEGIYQVIGMALREGRVLYSEIWDNKPPILYLIYAIFNSDQFLVRLASLIAGAAAVLVFYLLAIKLFKSIFARFLSTAFFALMFATPLLEGNIANAENFMLLPITAAFYLAVASSSKNRFIFTFVAGILISIAFLIKIVAVFDAAALFVTLFIFRFFEGTHLTLKNVYKQMKDIINGLEQETVLAAGFIFPIVLTVLYFLFQETLPDFLRAVFFQNVGYVGYGNFLLFPMGFLYFKLILLFFSVLLIIRYRKIFGKSGTLILIWLAFSIFNALFSQRPYTHYLLVMLPSFSLLLGYAIDNRKLLKVTLPLLIIVVFLVLTVFRLNFKNIVPYYENYLSFISNRKSVESYQAFFDRNTPRDYALSDFIKSKTSPNEYVYLWSDSAQIYVLAGKLPPGRYTVAYHVTFYPDAIRETKKAIDAKNVKYIIQTKEGPEIQQFLDNYELKYRLDGVNIYERKP
jgi:4-amino-4-deoxy-L-arabinose transferase-like glycosyltransferase